MMSWRMKAKLFGWDYVYIINSATSKICRVKFAPNGMRIFQPYSFQVLIIPAPLPISGDTISGWHVVPLTQNVTAKDI